MNILYSTHCPKCKLLEKQLEKLNIEYKVVDDKDVMLKKGFRSAPQLEINGLVMDYPTAMRWIMNKRGGQQ